MFKEFKWIFAAWVFCALISLSVLGVIIWAVIRVVTHFA